LAITAIYKRHMAGLGISYSGFCKLVRRHATEARPNTGAGGAAERYELRGAESFRAVRRRFRDTVAHRTDTSMPQRAASTSTFRYSRSPKKGDRRLFGSGFFAGKK